MAQTLPIIYVRGFAGSTSGIDDAAAIQRYMADMGSRPSPEEVDAGAGAVPDPAQDDDGSARQQPPATAESLFPVAKVVTYATPHGGIDIQAGGAIGDWFMDTFGPAGSDIFQERRMREYLMPEGQEDWTPQDGHWDARVPYTSPLPAERFLSLVGTNAGDYAAAAGWSSRAMGTKSDGLVQIEDAYLKGSNRAYMHRCHSGRYGIVNSEEGYQNMRRFLFGNLKVALGLTDLELRASHDLSWQTDVAVTIQGLSVLLHDQSTAHHCPVMLAEEAARHDTSNSPVPLITMFMLPVEPDQPRRYAVHLRIFGIQEKKDFFIFGSHLEQIADWEDTLIVDVVNNDDGLIKEASWQWNSTISGPISEATHLTQGEAQSRSAWSSGGLAGRG